MHNSGELVSERLRFGEGRSFLPRRDMAAGFSIESLNKAQREAVLSLNGPLLILAGAGTGKTRTVTCRMSALLENGVNAENILAVTFTNKSASEMAERVVGMVGKKRGKALTVCTFHSLCLRVLKRDIEVLGYKKKFAIMAGGDQAGMIRQLIIRKGGAKLNLKPGEVMGEISKCKSAEKPLDSIEDDLIAEIAVAYQNELRSQNAVDFDDLLLLGERVLREHEEVRAFWQDKYRYITVDEFQDTNSLQMRLLQQLVAAPQNNICVVGDDDQSIYGWRGAEVANILQFERFFPNPKVILLEENYRSSQAVLEVANSLIKNNKGRREKKLRYTIPGGDLVRLVSMPGDQEEADWIVSEIVTQRAEGRVLEDFAVLFRTNGQIRKMEESLRESKIPYRMVGAQSFYDRKEVKDILSYGQVLDNPELDIPLLRVLNTPPRGIGTTTSMAALEWSREKDQGIWKTLIDDEFLAQLSSKVMNSIRTFTLQVEEGRRSLVDGTNAGVVLDQWLREMDFHEWLMRQCKTDKEKDVRREAVSTTIASITEAIKKGKTLGEFLDKTALDSEKEDDLDKKSGVTLITLHAAKGLEYPVVYLVGLEQGILPHKRSVEEGTRDEERRLLYVGITRAKERMTMTYCSTRMKWGKEEACERSTFISELNPDWLQEEDYDDIMGAEASEDELRGFFSAMSSMLEE